MIGFVRGTLREKLTSQILVEVSGLGYEIEVPLNVIFGLPESGAEVSLFTHFVVREDAQLLYGFASKKDRDFFRQLIKINGVGPKMGVAILSGLDAPRLAQCIEDNDVSTLTKIPGVGKKTAERLLVELRDKMKDFAVSASDISDSNQPVSVKEDPTQEAESALIALGYKPQEASKAVNKIKGEADNVEDLIKLALKQML